MSTVKWHAGPMIGADTETTGINPHDDRIVTAAIVHVTPGEPTKTTQWLIHPGRDIPTEASDVHGWTTERLERKLNGAQALRIDADGETPLYRDVALFEIAAPLGVAMGRGIPVIAANAAFDLTLLEAELARNGLDTLASRPAGIRGVIDPMVLEKQYDPYRRVKGGCRGGKYKCGGCGVEDKKLSSLCTHYKVTLSEAHDAAADALAALRLAWRLAHVWPDAGRLRLETLHAHQITWRREQMAGLRSYFDKNAIEHDGCCGSWPVHAGCCAPVGVAS